MQATSLALDHLLRGVGEPVVEFFDIGPGHPEFKRAQTIPCRSRHPRKDPGHPEIAQAIRTADGLAVSPRTRPHLAAAEAWSSGNPVLAAERRNPHLHQQCLCVQAAGAGVATGYPVLLVLLQPRPGRVNPTWFSGLPYFFGAPRACRLRPPSNVRRGINQLEAASGPWNCAMIALDAGKSLRLRPSDAVRIGCLAGVLWITREGDPRDFFLTHGEFFELDRGVTIATALEPTLVSVEQLRLHAWVREILRRLRVTVGRASGVGGGIGI